MRVTVNNNIYDINKDNILTITFCTNPIVVAPRPIAATKYYDPKDKRYHTDINPNRVIEGPLSDENVPLTGDLADEWKLYIDDCHDLIETVGFIIFDQDPAPQSPKSHYFILYGMKDAPFGLLVFDLRISDHSNSDIEFPVSSMQDAYNKLKKLGIIDPAVALDDIAFPVENVLVGSVKHDSWDRAFNRLYNHLQKMRRKVLNRKKMYEEFKLSYIPVAVTSEGAELTLSAHLISYSACMKQFHIWESEGYTLIRKTIKIYEGKSLRQIDEIG